MLLVSKGILEKAKVVSIDTRPCFLVSVKSWREDSSQGEAIVQAELEVESWEGMDVIGESCRQIRNREAHVRKNRFRFA